ncbi:MAG: glycerophosphodiester phosphodiesterase family protein [Oceanicaulis sp.]
MIAALALALFAADPLTAGLPEPAAPMNSETTLSAYLRCLDEANVTLVSGHRGGPEPGYPENAVETFAHTLSHGPFLLEVDVRQTSDGVFVLMHDETLERTTTGEGRVDATDWSVLQTYQLVDNEGDATAFRAPSLAEALAWAEGRALLQLDVKAGVDIAELTKFVAQAGARDRAAVVAYTVEDALAAAAADSQVAVSVEITSAERLSELLHGGLAKDRLMAWTGVSPDPRPELWAYLEAEGVPAAFGSLWYMDGEVQETGDPSIYAELAAAGVDVLSSDLHRLAADTIAARRDPAPAVARCTAELTGR